MAHVPVGSYPFERWALEVQDGLVAAGFDAALDVRGPRAFQVVVPERQSDAAGAALAEIGYLSCPAPAALGGIKDWRPGLGPAQVQQAVTAAAEEYAAREAERQAAEAFSVPEEDLEERMLKKGFSRPWVMARFGDTMAVKGRVVEDVTPPKGHEWYDMTPLDAQIHVDMAKAAETIRRAGSRVLGVDVPIEDVRTILAGHYPGGTSTVWTKGTLTIWGRPTQEGPESED